jgi:hypothetical protein
MFSKKYGLLALGIFLISSTVFARTRHARIELADRVVDALIDPVKGEGPHPFLIVVAGDDVHVQDRLYAKLARAAGAQDFVTLRLDWSYKKKKGVPDPKREAEELGIVINQMMGSRMMRQYEIDLTKVALIAKGYGAKVAMDPSTGGTSDKVKATLLLNPSCDSAPQSFATLYAPFLAEKTPRLIIASTAGEGCTRAQIYSAGPSFGEALSLYMTAGDSLFKIGKSTANQNTVIMVASNWLKNLGWVPPKKSAPKKVGIGKHIHDAESAATHP